MCHDTPCDSLVMMISQRTGQGHLSEHSRILGWHREGRSRVCQGELEISVAITPSERLP